MFHFNPYIAAARDDINLGNKSHEKHPIYLEEIGEPTSSGWEHINVMPSCAALMIPGNPLL